MTRPALARIDDLTIDFTRRKIFRGKNKVISLSALSFNTLHALVEAAPAPLTAKELIEHAWQGSVVSDDTVTQRIRLLRRALGDDKSEPRYIETIRNSGYRLIPPVVPMAERPGLRLRPWAAAILLPLAIAGTAWFIDGGEISSPGKLNTATIPTGPVTSSDLADSARMLLKQRNPDSLAHAIKLYEQALAEDPDNPDIRAGLALALSLSVAWYGDRIELAQRAEHLARQALADSVSFNAEMALGLSLDAQGKLIPALGAYERAVALDPSHYGARASLAYLLQVKGRLVEALSHNIAAMERAPRGNLDVQVASCLRLLGFHAVASRWLERADRLDPDSAHAAPVRALDLMARGEIQQAGIVIDRALARGVQQVELFEYKVLLAMQSGDLAGARLALRSAPKSISHRRPFEVWQRIIDAAADGAYAAAAKYSNRIQKDIDDGDTWPGSYLYIAMLEVAAQRNDRAIVALQNLAEAGDRDYLWLEFLPPLLPLHGEPEFRRIVERMRADVEYQREQVLTAKWLPQELREGDLEHVTALPPAKYISE